MYISIFHYIRFTQHNTRIATTNVPCNWIAIKSTASVTFWAQVCWWHGVDCFLASFTSQHISWVAFFLSLSLSVTITGYVFTQALCCSWIFWLFFSLMKREKENVSGWPVLSASLLMSSLIAFMRLTLKNTSHGKHIFSQLLTLDSLGSVWR